MSVTSSHRDQVPKIASLDELPRATQNGLAFDALVTALGFPPDAIGRRIVGVSRATRRTTKRLCELAIRSCPHTGPLKAANSC